MIGVDLGQVLSVCARYPVQCLSEANADVLQGSSPCAYRYDTVQLVARESTGTRATNSHMRTILWVTYIFMTVEMLIPSRMDSAMTLDIFGITLTLRYVVPMVFALLLVYGSICRCALRGVIAKRRMRAALAPLLWIVPLLVSVLFNNDVWGADKEGSAYALVCYILPPLLMSLVIVVCPTTFDIKGLESRLLITILAIAGAAALSIFDKLDIGFIGISLSSMHGYQSGFWRYISPMGGAITTGFVFQNAAIVCLYRAIDDRYGARRNHGYRKTMALAAGFAAMTILGLSRGNALALSAGLVLTIAWSPLSTERKVKTVFAAILGIALVTVAFTWYSVRTLAPLARFIPWHAASGMLSSSDAVRLNSARVALRAMTCYPLTGTGMARLWPRDWLTEMRVVQGYVVAREPHNAFALIGSEAGLVGMVGFLCGGLCVTASIPRRLFGYRAAASSALVFCLVSSDVFVSIKVATCFFVLLGLAVATCASEIDEE